MIDKLKPCPFCGGEAEIVFENWKEISPVCGVYRLRVNHCMECMFVRMNGMNLKSEMIANNRKLLVETWNRRAGEQE